MRPELQGKCPGFDLQILILKVFDMTTLYAANALISPHVKEII